MPMAVLVGSLYETFGASVLGLPAKLALGMMLAKGIHNEHSDYVSESTTTASHGTRPQYTAPPIQGGFVK